MKGKYNTAYLNDPNLFTNAKVPAAKQNVKEVSRFEVDGPSKP